MSEALDALAFAPNAETLESAIALLAEHPENGGANDAALRREALARYAELPAPGMRPGRGWKHDYDKLRYDELVWTSDRRTVETVPFGAPAQDADPEADRPALATENAGGLVHLGATLLEPEDALRQAQGDANGGRRVIVSPLADGVRDGAHRLDGVKNAVVDWRADRFAALATAFQNCGAFVYVPEGVQLDAPVQLIFANSAARDEAVFPHVVVVLGKNARATVLERHVGEGDPFVCGIAEVHLAEGAELDYAVVQQSSEAARVIFSRAARCERDAQVRWHLAELGGALARTVLDAHLDAPGARAETSALFFNTGMQHVDLTSGADHAVGPTTSDTVVRSAATDRGQGRYVGNIVIRPKAHGSDASLRDDALLLSKRAHIDSIPALEIAANDVKAFHGATVGSLDEDALFYAGSRGIARSQALRLITLGFFEPVVARFPSESLRDEVRTALDRKIDDATEIDG
ncbi:MAG TPA: Fe-S cluster assembly protein SufD [Candidatus Elarobacter sp.]|nr:Fe-S cluster assembly protein SufD [Candidatus Elarobacter sp.]